MTTRDRNKESEQALAERKSAETKIKVLDTYIQNVKSDIDKNLDQLNTLDHNKDFLFKIFKSEDPNWVDQILKERERKLN